MEWRFWCLGAVRSFAVFTSPFFAIGASSMFGRLVTFVGDAIGRPRAQLTQRQQQLRFAWDLVAHCWRVLDRHRAEGMAAELTYRTIFSLIPVVVLGLVTVRIFGGLSEIESRVGDQLVSFFGIPDVPEVSYSQPDPSPLPESASSESPAEEPASGEDAPVESSPAENSPAENSPARDSRAQDSQGAPIAAAPLEPAALQDTDQGVDRRPPGQPPEEAQASIRWVLRELTEKVASVDFASIGVFGLLLFLYAAIALASSVESVFNLIYDAPAGRPLHLRVAIHWSIITLGSALLTMSLYLSGQLVDYLTQATGWSVTAYANHLLALLAGWVLLFLLYSLMPNTKVSVRAALVGSFVAAVLWEIAKFGFQVYVSTAVPYSKLYGSLGLIPLFLFWVYVTWFIILFGLVWTYTLQTAPGRVPSRDEDEETGELLAGDPQWLVPIMVEIGSSFTRGENLSAEGLRGRVGLPMRIIHSFTDLLERAGLVQGLDGERGRCLTLARPAERITLADILRCGYHHPRQSPSRGWQRLEEYRLEEAARIGSLTLNDLISQSEPKPTAPTKPAMPMI